MSAPHLLRAAIVSLAASSVLVASAPLSAGPTTDGETGGAPRARVRFEVAREGLRYTGPCSVTVFPARARGAAPEEGLEHDDLDTPLLLPYGSYEWRAACPSTEGTLRRTQRLAVQKPEVVARASLRPAFLLARVLREGAEVGASIEVRDSHGHLVQEGRDKAVLPVPPGTLRVIARVDAQTGDSGRPVGAALEVKTQEGAKRSVDLDTSDGELRVDVRENGRPAEAVLALREPGEPLRVLEFTPGEAVKVSPGTYDVVSQLVGSHDFAEVVKEGVRIPSRARIALTLHHETGRLVPQIQLPGSELAPDLTLADIEVQLHHAGAPQPFNALATGDAATLTPGRYLVVARALHATLDDQSPWRAEAEAVVKKGTTQRVELRFPWSMLTTRTSLGGQAQPMEVQVFRPGAEAPVYVRASDQAGQLNLRLPPGRWRVQALYRTSAGELAQSDEVELRAGARRQLDLDLDVVPAIVQVMQDGFAVAAEVSFWHPRAAAPLRTVRAGEEVHVPPGRYILRVQRRGQTFTFPAVELVSGVLFDKTLSLEGQTPTRP